MHETRHPFLSSRWKSDMRAWYASSVKEGRMWPGTNLIASVFSVLVFRPTRSKMATNASMAFWRVEGSLAAIRSLSA